MYYSIFWLIMVILLAVVEILTVNLVTIWFALGALGALIFSLFDIGFIWQMWCFIIISVASLALTKPLVKKKLLSKKASTNADMLIGKNGIVTESISSDKFAGEVKVSGQVWSAVCEGEETIEKGSKVKVIRIEGVKLVVKEIAQ